MSMATLLGDAGRLEEGLKFIQKAVAAGSDNPDVYNNYAAYLLRLGKGHLHNTIVATYTFSLNTNYCFHCHVIDFLSGLLSRCSIVKQSY